MANNFVAYVGLNSFDIILYLSRILQKLGRRVLIVDNSETTALAASIPPIDGLDSKKTTISYRRVDFTRMAVTNELAGQYDDILIDCGMKEPIIERSLFSRIVYVTDLFEYNMKRLSMIHHYDDLQIEHSLLIRDVVYSNISTELVSAKVQKKVIAEKIEVLYRDDSDYENCLLCHYNQVFRLKLSKMFRNYLIREVHSYRPELSDKDIKVAYHRARKGD